MRWGAAASHAVGREQSLHLVQEDVATGPGYVEQPDGEAI